MGLYHLNNCIFVLLGTFLFVFRLSHIASASVQFSNQGFQLSLLASNLNPTQLTALPDGRILLLEKHGVLRVFRDGVIQPVQFNLSDVVDDYDERGLLGIAADPSFPLSPYIYLYYTHISGHNRVARFTMSDDSIDRTSEVLLMELDALSSAGNHNGGGLVFDNDEKLYVSVGENANSANAQSNGTLLGKIHRLNKDGSIPADNPFFKTLPGKLRSIWTLGVRNPWTISASVNNTIVFFDVGKNSWEEINFGASGANYGWPLYQGYTSANPVSLSNYQNPIYSYSHGGGNQRGCSIMGGPVYRNDRWRNSFFPEMFHNKLFFADYCNGWINYIDVLSTTSKSPNVNSAQIFLTGLDAPVHLIQSLYDGCLYVSDRGTSSSNSNTAVKNGKLYKICYAGVSSSPSIYQQPQSIIVGVGENATFQVQVTGFAPMQYQWMRNGQNISGANSSAFTTGSLSLADSGSVFAVQISNRYPPPATSDNAILTVLNRSRPVIQNFTLSISTNSTSVRTKYRAGDLVQFAAAATDSQQGELSPASFSCTVVFHHQTHTHPFLGPLNGISSSNFEIPVTGETDPVQWYRVHLAVTNDANLTSQSFLDVFPDIVTLTFESTFDGVLISIDGEEFATPYQVDAVVGMHQTISAVLSDPVLEFLSWSDGGDLSHEIVVPAENVTLLITYQTTAPFTTPSVQLSSSNWFGLHRLCMIMCVVLFFREGLL